MKNLYLLIFLFHGFLINAQETTKYSKAKEDSLVKEIRKKYKLINENKESYKVDETYWNYEADELDNDTEYENNEDGNEEITTTTYSKNEEIMLETCTKLISKYQFPYSLDAYSETYYWEGEVFFVFKRGLEILSGPDYSGMSTSITDLDEGETRVVEYRFYYNEGKCFRALIKEDISTGIKNTDDILSNKPNVELNLEFLSDLYYDIEACLPESGSGY